MRQILVIIPMEATGAPGRSRSHAACIRSTPSKIPPASLNHTPSALLSILQIILELKELFCEKWL